MNLMDVVNRSWALEPWAEGEKIPWNDPDFSARMLREHLTQDHDLASRRFEVIDRHVNWIHTELLGGKAARILDLGCGPGLYTSRFAALGHTCVGIDFSPASIEYAQAEAQKNDLACSYHMDDVRRAEFGGGYDLAMQVFGEINVFRPADAQLIINKAFAALKPGGILLLEVHTISAVEGIGRQPRGWFTAQSGLFSDKPYLFLSEAAWDETRRIAIERMLVVDAETARVERYAASTKAYTPEEYQAMLAEAGFTQIKFYHSLDPQSTIEVESLYPVVARKPA